MLSERKIEIYKKIVSILAESSTCDRAKVGCLILKDNRIISTGYNGSLPGDAHCTEDDHILIDGHCVATVHAEQNALSFMARNGIPSEGCELFCTHLPCMICTKLIIQSGIKKVYYIHDYKNQDNLFLRKLKLVKI